MRVLDLDLDFFLNDVAYLTDSDTRLKDDEYSPWSDGDVIAFLEDRCGLSRERPIPGRIVEHHHGAFLYWREMIKLGSLTRPFEVVHVDAHADLGLGDGGYQYLMGEVLHWDVAARQYPEIGLHKCGLGNYLAFATACRWLDRLVYVTHPLCHHDLIRYHFKDWDPDSGFLQLKSLSREQMEELVWGNFERVEPLALEPEVPFTSISSEDFVDDGSFDRIVLCRSPGFTPPSADRLIPIIAQYMDSD